MDSRSRFTVESYFEDRKKSLAGILSYPGTFLVGGWPLTLVPGFEGNFHLILVACALHDDPVKRDK